MLWLISCFQMWKTHEKWLANSHVMPPRPPLLHTDCYHVQSIYNVVHVMWTPDHIITEPYCNRYLPCYEIVTGLDNSVPDDIDMK